MKSYLESPIFDVIHRAAEALNVETYVIGGYVRDRLLQRREPKDVDIVAVGSGIALAEKVSELLPKHPKVQVFKNFGTAMLRHEDWEVEFVGARKESYRSNSRKPIVENGTLEDDQNRRDFTINALAIGLNTANYGELIDPFGGLKDLDEGIIRTPLNPDATYSDDPLRMMRGIRFATQLGFAIEKESFDAIARNAHRIEIISQERITDELNKIMASSRPSVGWVLLEETGLLKEFFPELLTLKGIEDVDGQTHKDNFYHTLQVVDNLSATSESLWLRWAALLHDIGKPVSKRFDKKAGWTFHGHEFIGGKMVPKIFRKLKLPNNEKMKYVQKMVRMSSRPTALSGKEVTDSAVRRLLFDAGEDVDDLMLLCEADMTTQNERKKKRYLQNYQLVRQKLKEVEERDRVVNFEPPISGKDIMETFHVPPGRVIGEIKSSIKEAILEGNIQNDRDQAWKMMIDLAREKGLKPIEK
jgi:poly(A) polymerase